ncbi:zinc ribbon domain-containing protein [Haloplanus salilacus]|uniref:zinc ribbon domain-containing protein n=1 Tax=Haloplanus salilacus TaxID=2949994 RepID=UPI0030D4D59A
MVDSDRRALVAVAASAVGALFGVAGLGHAYLREWARAFAWFTFVLGTGLLLIAAFTDPTTVTLETLPLRVTLPLAALLLVHTLDAYYVARRPPASGSAAPSAATDGPTVDCPSCGRELDPELSFCPWCAGPRTPDDDADSPE